MTSAGRDAQPPLVRLMQEATAAQERGDFEQAEGRYRALTARFPHFPDAWHYYGILLHQRGEHDRALELMRKAESLDPANLVFLLNLAAVLREQRRLDESLRVLERAHALDPEHGQVLTQLIQIHLLVQRGGDLIENVEARIERDPRNWRLWMLLGECCEQGGERERAMDAFADAARLASRSADTTEALVRLGWAARAAGDLRRAESAFHAAAAAAEADSDPDANPHAGWAYAGLATVASERGQFEHAASLARTALARDGACYAAWRVLANTAEDRHSERFANEVEEAIGRAGDDPRAWLLHFAHGQTLERRKAYEKAFAAYAQGNAQRSRHRPYSRVDQRAYTRDIIAHLDRAFVNRAGAVGVAAPGAIFICGMPRSGTTLVESILAAHPDVAPGGEMRHVHDQLRRRLRHVAHTQVGTWLAGTNDDTLHELAKGWSGALGSVAGTRPRVTDKMPGNFALLGLIHVCLPEARIVHVRRDPRDTGFSCFATPFSEGLEFSFDLEDIGHFYRHYRELVGHWRKVLGAERIVEVDYERLVRNPEDEVRRLLAALDLAWDPRCLAFHAVPRTVSTASVFQVRQPIYTGSIGRWRHFEKHLEPLLAALEDALPASPDTAE